MTLTAEEINKIIEEEITSVLSEGDDRCTRIAKRKYDVWPSAYASGAVVRCRQGKIWKGLKEEDIGDQVNEDLLDEEGISEGLKYHIKEGVGVDKNVYRPDSECFFNMFKEVRKLHKEGRYKLNENEKHYILETDLGEFGMFEGQEVPLDHPMVNEEKDPPIGKPSKNTEGGKKYKVFVRDPKTGNIRKITYGDKKGGLKGNWNSAEARSSFAARHKCAEKSKKPNKRLTPGYWSCRAHKDFGKNVPGRFW